MNDGNTMDIGRIMEFLPHRYPLLLVDRVLAYTPGESLEAIKNVSVNEPFFQGHFPGRPVMPGVMIIEALAQAAGLLAFVTQGGPPDPGMTFYFVSIDKARFRRPVLPGDTLALNVTFGRILRGIWRFSAKASVDGETAASCELMVAPRGGMD